MSTIHSHTRRLVERFLASRVRCESIVASVTTSWAATSQTLGSIACTSPPPDHCRGAVPPRISPNRATWSTEGRTPVLSRLPCDLERNEKVVFILSLHDAGAMATGIFIRHYFPALDYVDKYRSGHRDADGGHTGCDAVGNRAAACACGWRITTRVRPQPRRLRHRRRRRRNVESFWLAGHSRGGIVSNRLVCTDFSNKVDGWLSLSAAGSALRRFRRFLRFWWAARRFRSSNPNAPRPGFGAMPTCEISYILSRVAKEITGLPETSPLAAKYHCDARVRRPDIVDERKGVRDWHHARASGQLGPKSWSGHRASVEYPASARKNGLSPTSYVSTRVTPRVSNLRRLRRSSR